MESKVSMFNFKVPITAFSRLCTKSNPTPVALLMMPSLTVPLYRRESVKLKSGPGQGNKTVSPCTKKALT